MNRKIPLYFLLLIVFLGMITTVLFGASVHHVLVGNKYLGGVGDRLLTIAKFPSLVVEAITEINETSKLLTPNHFPTLDGFKENGVIPNSVKEDDGYLLLSSYDHEKAQSSVQLIRIRDQKVIHEWLPSIDALKKLNTYKSRFTRKILKSSFRIIHPLLLDNGHLVFHYRTSLFAMDACSVVSKSLPGVFHHSIELDAEDNIWVPSIIDPPSYMSKLKFRDDAIAKVSPQGELLFMKSIAQILDENGYRGLLAGNFNADPIHLNDIQPVHTDSEFWKAGDLFLSMRSINTVMLYRPSSNKIIWLRTGPWINQHDVNVVSDHEITVFGNDVIDNPSKTGSSIEQAVFIDGHSNVYRYDFRTDSIATPYSDILKEMKVRTRTQGRSRVLNNGDVFIEEQNNGRILRVSPDTAKWQYVRRINEEHLSMLAWSRYLTQDQVKVVLPILENNSCVH